MANQVIMDDGNENTIDDHMRDDSRKGARGMSEEHSSDMHRNLHQRKSEPMPGQPGQPGQPAKDREKDMPGEDRDPVRPPRKDSKRDNKRK